MSRLGAELLDVLAAHLPAVLAPPRSLELLRSAAPLLAPVARLGVECRLAEPGAPVDLSQHLRAADGGADALARLARFRSHVGAPGARAAWVRVADFADAWAGPGPLADGVDEAWLEYDLERECGVDTVPSVFAGFAPGRAEGGRAFLPVIRRLAPGAVEATRALAATLEHAASLGAEPVGVVGAMLPRGGELRCVLRGLTAETARELLRRAGWPGPPDAADRVFAGAGALALEVRLGLGFAPRIAPTLGLELILGVGSDTGGRGGAVLDALVADGLCIPAVSSALREWRGPITPLTSAAPWPAALVAAGLIQPAGRLGMLLRYLNHVKIGVRPDGSARAKAYVACVHVWGGAEE